MCDERGGKESQLAERQRESVCVRERGVGVGVGGKRERKGEIISKRDRKIKHYIK